ncbi:MAG TPA: alpha/beta fold hydrolase [Gemmatimonadaceae bacterium]|nr:alpha/beta fold hydrolase [Gemmatimonadaceae bacterium]
MPIVAAHAEAQQPRAARQLAPGNHEFNLRHGGRTRTYIVYVPRELSAPPPVLLAFHGGGGNADGFQKYAELDAVADRERFLVVYPNGTGPLPRRLLTWNAGDGCCGYARQRNVDDVGFAAALIGDLEKRTRIDRRRIYATGHSNGGIMSHRVAAERPDLVAAVVPVAGSLDLMRFKPARPVAVLQIHSVDDPRALYGGGLGPPFPGTNNRILHQPVVAGLERWVAANSCGAPDTTDVRRGAAGTRMANHTATRIVWRSCRGGVEVAHWRLTGSGHAWPGDAPPPGSEAISGPQTTIVRTAEEVWAFASRFSR